MGAILSLPAGIGTLLGAWLAQQHGASIVLLGRSGYFASTLPELLLSEAPITAARCDVAVAEEAALGDGAAGCAPLAAVLHAGGVLHDGVLLRQTAASVRGVFAPKLAFMRHAGAAAAHQPVAQLNLFASVSAFLGSPGQSNYAAANMALNAWAESLQQHGTPGGCQLCRRVHIWPPLTTRAPCGSPGAGSSIQWGAWAGVGMAHGNAAVLARVDKSGLGVVQPAEGLAALLAVLSASSSPRLVQSIASPFNFDRLLHGLDPPPYIFSSVVGEEVEPGAGSVHLAAAPAGTQAPPPPPSAAEVLGTVRGMVQAALGAQASFAPVVLACLQAPCAAVGLAQTSRTSVGWPERAPAVARARPRCARCAGGRRPAADGGRAGLAGGGGAAQQPGRGLWGGAARHGHV